MFCLLTVCFERADDTNAVAGIISKGAHTTDDPKYWYFGDFGDDVDGCEEMCRQQPNCQAFA